MSATGIIFSNIHDYNIPELTKRRAIAAVPFACRYRFIDFVLSNMVNSDIFNVDVIATENYQSLLEHIGSGKDWDLARNSGGIKILPPFITAYNGTTESDSFSRLECLKSLYSALTHIKDEYVVLSDCDVVCNVDLRDLLRSHAESGADITLATKKMTLTADEAKRNVLFTAGEDGRITDVLAYPSSFEGEAEVALNLVAMRTDYLLSIIEDATAHGYQSITRDIIARHLTEKVYRVYRYDGYFASVSSLEEYYKYSMELLNNPEVRNAIFGVSNRPIYTRVRNSAPTYFAPSSKVSNSMIADGCVIEGEVENSILFRGVHIGKNCKIRNSILMRETLVEEGVNLNCVLTDKNVVIRTGKSLSGCEALPYFIDKGKII